MIQMTSSRERPKRAASAIAINARDPMFISTPGFTPASTRRDSLPTNKTTMSSLSTTASAVADFNNKENFHPSIADRIKQSRRVATKKYSSTSPSKSVFNPIPKPDLTEMTIYAAPAVHSPKRALPDEIMEPPPSKRPRCHSEAHVSSIPNSPQRSEGNLAALVHSNLLDLSLPPNPLRLPSDTPEAVQSKHQPMYNPPIPQPRHSLPPLRSVISTDDGPYAVVFGDHTMPRIRTTERLRIGFAGEHQLQRKLYPGNSCKTALQPMRYHMSCPSSYPSPADQPAQSRPDAQAVDIARSPKLDISQASETLPMSYPQPSLYPLKTTVGSCPTKAEVKNPIATAISDVRGPTSYPELVIQPLTTTTSCTTTYLESVIQPPLVTTSCTTTPTVPTCEVSSSRPAPAAEPASKINLPNISAHSVAHLRSAQEQEQTTSSEVVTSKGPSTLR